MTKVLLAMIHSHGTNFGCRYALGIVICSLSLVTIVLALIGIVMGMAGFRKDRDPNQRTKLSHCGGIFLMM